MLSRTVGGNGLRAFGKSHPGLQRENNEDRHHVDADRGLFMVIDGVGGHAAGEKAAETALQMLLARLERETGTAEERLREAITLANNEIFRLAAATPEWQGMACVLTVAHVNDGVVTVGHVGDTRLYKCRDGSLRKLTHDHSPVGEREDRGELTEQEAMQHPRRNEIYRDVGTEEHSPNDAEFIEVVEAPFEPDAALLLCSDGLTDLVPAARLRDIVYRQAGDGPGVVQRLIEEANAAGGKDNVTAVYVEGEAFASAARLVSLAAEQDTVKTRPRGMRRLFGSLGRRGPARAPHRGRWRTRATRAGWLLAGLCAGLFVAYLAATQLRSLPGWLARAGVSLSWSRTWTAGPVPGSDFVSIADALASARAGDTVQVQPGEYREAIRLRDGVALVGFGAEPGTIRPPIDAAPGWIAVEAAEVSGARLANLRILGDEQGSMAVGIRVRQADVEIEHVEISGAAQAALEFDGPGAATLRGSFIHHNPGAGVVVRGDAAPRVMHNVIADNGTTPANLRPGMTVDGAARPVIFGNIVVANGVDGILGLPQAEREAVARSNAIGPLVPPVPRSQPVPRREAVPGHRPEAATEHDPPSGRGKQ